MAAPTSRLAANPAIPPATVEPVATERPIAAEYVPGELTRKFLSEKPADPGKISTDIRPYGLLAENFRHSGWAPFRRKVEQALSSTDGISERRVSAFRCCGCDASVQVQRNVSTGHIIDVRIRSTKCHDRFCVPCSQERASRVRASLLTHMNSLENLKLVTLTLAASDRPLTEILDRITRCLRLLRAKPIWKKNVQGGVTIIETKIGENSGKWHVHFHVIVQAKYVKQSDLSDAWLAVTGDSRIVDIRAVGAKTGAVSYITKYVTKAADHAVVNSPRHLGEAVIAFQGRRLISTFGSWRGLQLNERPDDEVQESVLLKWDEAGSLDAILSAAESGDEWSRDIVRRLRRGRGRPPPGV